MEWFKIIGFLVTIYFQDVGVPDRSTRGVNLSEFVAPVYHYIKNQLWNTSTPIIAKNDTETDYEEIYHGDVETNEVAISLRDDLIRKSKNHIVTPHETKTALQILGSSTFKEYSEKWTTRFATYEKKHAAAVIEDMALDYKWERDDVAKLIRMVQNQLRDQRTQSEFKIKEGVNLFHVYYISMYRKGNIVQMGIAHGEVIFKFNDQEMPIHETKTIFEKGGWFSKDVTTTVRKQIDTKFKERHVNFNEKDILEKYFFGKALSKFIEDIPVEDERSVDSNEFRIED